MLLDRLGFSEARKISREELNVDVFLVKGGGDGVTVGEGVFKVPIVQAEAQRYPWVGSAERFVLQGKGGQGSYSPAAGSSELRS